MTITALLKTHNELAKAQGKMGLKDWKGPKDKLQERIDNLKKNETKKAIDKKPRVTAKDIAEKMIEKEQKRKETADDMLTIVQVAEGINMDPKVARAKLRRKGKHANEGRWPLVKKNSVEHKELIALLTGK